MLSVWHFIHVSAYPDTPYLMDIGENISTKKMFKSTFAPAIQNTVAVRVKVLFFKKIQNVNCRKWYRQLSSITVKSNK